MPQTKPATLSTRRSMAFWCLQLDTGAQPLVDVGDERLRCDATYVAAREIFWFLVLLQVWVLEGWRRRLAPKPKGI